MPPYAGAVRRLPPVIDALSVLAFVGIGRAAHDHGVSPRGMVSTAWPFVLGLLVGWLVVARQRRALARPLSGEIVVVVTVALGMVLRVIAGQGTALAFIVVAWLFLTLFLVGWRLCAQHFVNP